MKTTANERSVHADQWMRTKQTVEGCLLVMAVFLSSIVCGCMDIQVRMGREFNHKVLEGTLRVGESTPTDVLEALGEPFGKGKAMLPIDPAPKTMWTYHYGEANMKDARGIYLFVFFDQDRYDGYMWFSSLTKELPKPAAKQAPSTEQ